MSLLGNKKAGRYGVLFDIGSGSVLSAIVHSDPDKPQPTVVWSAREHVPLRNSDGANDSARAVMSALVNAAMELDSDGRKVLREYDSNAQLSELQCGVSAPWSYTVTKSITYAKDEPFLVTGELLESLITSAERKTSTELKHNEAVQDLGLTIVDRSTLDIKANGYHVTHPEGNHAQEIALTHASVVTQTHLIDALVEMQEKLFPKTSITISSSMLMLHKIVSTSADNPQNYCIIDITFEATEIGIVRDGALQFCTHVPIGVFTIARKIANKTNNEVHEIYSHLKNGSLESFLESTTADVRQITEAVMHSYIAEVADLFTETGDELAIPRYIYTHSGVANDSFTREVIKSAATKVLKTKPHITPLTIEQLIDAPADAPTKKTSATTAQATIAALFFHTN